FNLTRLNVSRQKTLPLQSHLTRKVLISAHRNSFTADKLTWAKIIDFSLSLYGSQHFWTEFRILLDRISSEGLSTLVFVDTHTDQGTF
ncbi:hypothetical protein PO909_024608, partial [Leuciscus waleckii]